MNALFFVKLNEMEFQHVLTERGITLKSGKGAKCMKKKSKTKYVEEKAKQKYICSIKWLLCIAICLATGILAGKNTQAAGVCTAGRSMAANVDIPLGTQEGGDIEAKLGDTLNFSLNTVDESSIYYSMRDEIVMVTYYVDYEYGEREVLSKESDTVFRVTGVGSTYLTVSVRDQYGEEISERSYRIVSSVDMSNVALEKNSIKDYRYGQEYSYKTFYVKVNGLEGVQGEDIDFSYTSSNKKMYVYCKFDDGQIVIETSGAGTTLLEFTVNEKVMPLTLTIHQVKLSCSTSFLMVPKGTKSIKVQGISGRVTWKSSNPKVISVSKAGKLKAKKTGNVVITASVGTGKLGCVVSVVTKARKKVIAMANRMGKNWKYSQAKRMQKGYYDCSSLVWKSYKLEKQYFGMKYYAPVAADLGKWCAKNKKMVKGNAYQNIQKMKYRPGALTFKTGSDNGRYKGIYHVEMFVGYTFEGFSTDGKPVLGTKWAARGDNYFYGELWAQP